MKLNRVTLIILFLIFIGNMCFAKTKTPAEIYFTSSEASDPYNKNYEIAEIDYGQSFNLVGINFYISKDVHIYLGEEYVGLKKVEDDKFQGIITVSQQEAEDKNYTVKVDGAARGETLEKDIFVKIPAAIPAWVWIVGGLLIIAAIVYYIYIKMFQE